MASPSPWTWSWNTSDYSTLTRLCNSSSSSSQWNSSRSLLYSNIAYRERSRLITFSLHDSSSSTPNSNAESGSRKRANFENPASLRPIEFGNSKEKDVSLGSIRLRNRPVIVTFNSFFGKRSLWRRILFASKKVRSIILLNVITVIYGKNFSHSTHLPLLLEGHLLLPLPIIVNLLRSRTIVCIVFVCLI